MYGDENDQEQEQEPEQEQEQEQEHEQEQEQDLYGQAFPPISGPSSDQGAPEGL